MTRSTILALIVFSAALACATEDRPRLSSSPASKFVMPGRGTFARDSAGVEILDFPLPLESLPFVFSIDSVPGMDLGGNRGDVAHNLEQPENDQHALRLKNSGILVKDANTLELFDSTNTHIITIGGSGTGRGELQNLRAFCIADGDTVLALEENRVSVFTLSGKFVRSSPAPLGPGAIEPSGCFSDGTILLLTDLRQDSTAVARLSANARRMMIDGREVRTIGPVEAGTTSPTIFMKANNIVFRDLLISGDGRKAEIRIFRMSGRLRRLIRWNESPTLVTPNLLQSFVAHTSLADEFEEDLKRAFSTVQPSSLPVYYEIRVDETGRIWLQDYPEVLVEPQPPVAWTVFDSTGAPIGRVAHPTVPGAVTEPAIVWIGKDQLLLRWTDQEQYVHLTYHGINSR